LTSTDRFAVMLAVDRNMFPPAVFTAHTVRRHAPKTPFDLIIAVPENTLPRAWIDYAESHAGVTVRECAFDHHLAITRTSNRYLPPSATYRYFFDRFLTTGYRKVIYLDADIEVRGDISALFALDLEGHAFAAAPDALIDSDARATVRDYRARLGLTDETCYANSGVLVINPERWTQQGLTERVIRYLGDHLDDCYWVDQDALNAVVRGGFQKLSPVWNMMAILWYRSDIAATIAPAVLHYADTSKPWRPLMWRYDRAVTERYRDFFRATPWPDAVSWSGSPAEWAMFLRFRQRATLRWLRRRPALKPLPPETMAMFRRQLATLPFGDIRQSLAVWHPDGSLRAG
jgi:lipopolysaccharide biosynthesis glycosyltransferase